MRSFCSDRITYFLNMNVIEVYIKKEVSDDIKSYVDNWKNNQSGSKS